MIKKELVIIGDRSGSMRKIVNDTVQGINNCITKTKNDKDENENIRVSLKLFNNREEMIWNGRFCAVWSIFLFVTGRRVRQIANFCDSCRTPR